MSSLCRAAVRARVAALRAFRRAAGVCVDCGDDSAGDARCDACHRRQQDARRCRYTQLFDRAPRPYYCTGCGEPGHNVRTCVAPAGGFWSGETDHL